MRLFGRDKTAMVTPDEALPGRSVEMGADDGASSGAAGEAQAATVLASTAWITKRDRELFRAGQVGNVAKAKQLEHERRGPVEQRPAEAFGPAHRLDSSVAPACGTGWRACTLP